MICRVCGGEETTRIIERPAPALTSAAEQLDLHTAVHACRGCGHLSTEQTPDADYYAHDYDTVAGADDDLMGVDDLGAPIYRVELQTDALFEMLELAATGRLLDFGCGHGLAMRRFEARRPQWQVEGYEVGERYAGPGVATGALPSGPYDLVTAFYVHEHLESPTACTTLLAERLTAGGRLLLAVPDVMRNPIDALVVDHASHFTTASLVTMVQRAGLIVEHLSTSILPASLVATARRRTDQDAPSDITRDDAALWSLGDYWHEAERTVRHVIERAAAGPGSIAIYGAGVYGSFMASLVPAPRETIACVLDRNPRKQGTTFMGHPVVAPEAIPQDAGVVLLGVRPETAATLLDLPELAGRHLIGLPEWSMSCTT